MQQDRDSAAAASPRAAFLSWSARFSLTTWLAASVTLVLIGTGVAVALDLHDRYARIIARYEAASYNLALAAH